MPENIISLKKLRRLEGLAKRISDLADEMKVRTTLKIGVNLLDLQRVLVENDEAPPLLDEVSDAFKTAFIELMKADSEDDVEDVMVSFNETSLTQGEDPMIEGVAVMIPKKQEVD